MFHGIYFVFTGSVGLTNFQTTKMAGYAKEVDVVDGQMKKLKEFCRKRRLEHKERA